MKTKKQTKKAKTRHRIKANVSKSFFAVMPKYWQAKQMSVLLLGDTKQMAISVWEKWNDGRSYKTDTDLGIVKISAKNVC